MPSKEQALRDFWRMMRWIIAVGVLAAAGSIIYLGVTGELYLHMFVATIIGVFFSVALGGGLMAAAFFSDKSAHDQAVTDATKPKSDE